MAAASLEGRLLKNVAWLLCLCALLASGFAAGVPPGGSQPNNGRVLYKWVDKEGVTHYGDHVPPEYATQEQAILIGKPASEFFTLACQNMGVPLAATVVVGDDLEADVGGAKFAGCVGVLVRTGKFRPDQTKTSEIRPDAILDSLADLPSLMS